jgi:hypothetical protein
LGAAVSYARARRCEIANRVPSGAPVETREANSAGHLGPCSSSSPSACQKESQEGCAPRASVRALQAQTGLPVTPPTADERIAWPGAEERRGATTYAVPRLAIAGEVDNIGELVHGSPPLWLMSKAVRRASERLGPADVSATGFRPVDADAGRRRIRDPVRERAARDAAAHVSSVGLGSADWNAVQAGDRLLIRHPDRVNQEVRREIALAHS